MKKRYIFLALTVIMYAHIIYGHNQQEPGKDHVIVKGKSYGIIVDRREVVLIK